MNIKFDYPLPLSDGLKATEADVPSVQIFDDHLQVNVVPSNLGIYLLEFFPGEGGDYVFTKEETEIMQKAFGIILEHTKTACQNRYPEK